MSDFKYSAEKINKMIDESGCQKAIMSGVYNDLKKLKPIIEKIYDENIFILIIGLLNVVGMAGTGQKMMAVWPLCIKSQVVSVTNLNKFML